MINPELDLALLRSIATRDVYTKYIHLIDQNSIANESKLILKAYGQYFNDFPDKTCIELNQFVPWFFKFKHATFSTEEQNYYRKIFSRLVNIDKESIDTIVESLRYKNLGLGIIKTLGLDCYLSDKVIDVPYFDTKKLEEALVKFNKSIGSQLKVDSHDLSLLFDNTLDYYIPTRLASLNRIMKGFKSDFFHLVIAGTDGGKTAFCISEACNLVQRYPEGNVVFFTNEQSSRMIHQRIVSSLLNKKGIEFLKFKQFVLDNPQLCQKKYMESGGDRIQIVNVFGKSVDYIKKYCDHYAPKLIIIDQIDNLITGKMESAGRPYNDMYKKIRSEIAQVYGAVIGTTQAKNRGRIYSKDNSSWWYNEDIDSGCVHWSNVDKQANVDVIIGMGVMNNDTNKRHLIVDRHKEGLCGDCYCYLNPHSSTFFD